MSDQSAGHADTGQAAAPPGQMSSAEALPESWRSALWRGLKSFGRFVVDCVEALDVVIFVFRIFTGLGRAIVAIVRIFD